MQVCQKESVMEGSILKFYKIHKGIVNLLCRMVIILFIVFFRHILETEGVQGLFRGLGPNLVGVAPSR